MVEENIQVENQEVVMTEQPVEQVALTEEVEQPQFAYQVTIKGDVNTYSWGNGEEPFVKYCTFNTTIGEEVYSTTIGVTEENMPMATISYNGEINVDVINFIVNHVIMVACEQTTKNDELFYNKEGNTMAADEYNPITPVIQMVGVLHSWANIIHFQSTSDQEEEVLTPVQSEEVEVIE